jgi:hypothetical protein
MQMNAKPKAAMNIKKHTAMSWEQLQSHPLSPESTFSSESEGSADENWEEEWGAVTIQSLVRGHVARKLVKRIRKRRRRVSRVRKHRNRKKHRMQRKKTPPPSPNQAAPAPPDTGTVKGALAALSQMKREKDRKTEIFQQNAGRHATSVQRMVRGHLARLQVAKIKRRREVDNLKRELLRKEQERLRQQSAATRIQAVQRGRSARAEAGKLRKLRERERKEQARKAKAATSVQKIARGFLCRIGIIALVAKLAADENKKLSKAKKRKERRILSKQQHVASVRIQSLWRGVSSRNARRKEQKDNRKREKAAKVVQHACRKHLDRKRARVMEHAAQNERKKASAKSGETKPVVPSKHSPGAVAHRKKRRAPTVINSEIMKAGEPMAIPPQNPAPKRSTAPEPKVEPDDALPDKKVPEDRTRAKQRFEHRARINPMVDEPLYDFESLLSGLWEGESLDNDGNVTQIFDCILRFYKDPSNGQAMIEGRAKTRCQNNVGVIIMEGVFDWGSSRCILVVEGKKCEGGHTYMGWVSPPAKLGNGALGMAIDQCGHGVGYTLEASFQQYMFHLKKKQNTRRAEMRPIRQLINNARSRANVGRPGSNDRSSSAKSLIANNPMVVTPEQTMGRMVTNVSAMLANFRFQMEAVERRSGKDGGGKSDLGVNSIVHLMSELESRLPAVKATLESKRCAPAENSIWSTTFIRGNSKESNRARSSKPQATGPAGIGTLAATARHGSSGSIGTLSRESSAGSTSRSRRKGRHKRQSLPSRESVEDGGHSSSDDACSNTTEERTVTPIQSHYKHLFSSSKQPHEYGVHWKSSAQPILVSHLRRRNTAGTMLAPMQGGGAQQSPYPTKKKGKIKVRSSKQPKEGKAHRKHGLITKRKHHTPQKLEPTKANVGSKKNKCSDQQKNEVHGLLGKLKIRNKVLQAEKQMSQTAALESKMKPRHQNATTGSGAKQSYRLSTVEELSGHAPRGRGGVLQGW